MHFCNFLKKALENFRKFSGVRGGGAPGPPTSPNPKMFPPNKNPGYAMLQAILRSRKMIIYFCSCASPFNLGHITFTIWRANACEHALKQFLIISVYAILSILLSILLIKSEPRGFKPKILEEN